MSEKDNARLLAPKPPPPEPTLRDLMIANIELHHMLTQSLAQQQELSQAVAALAAIVEGMVWDDDDFEGDEDRDVPSTN